MLHFITRNIPLSRLNLNVNNCQALWEGGNGGNAPLKFHLMWKPVHNRFWSHKNQPLLLWQLHLFFWKITEKLKKTKKHVNNRCRNRSSVVTVLIYWSTGHMMWWGDSTQSIPPPCRVRPSRGNHPGHLLLSVHRALLYTGTCSNKPWGQECSINWISAVAGHCYWPVMGGL